MDILKSYALYDFEPVRQGLLGMRKGIEEELLERSVAKAVLPEDVDALENDVKKLIFLDEALGRTIRGLDDA